MNNTTLRFESINFTKVGLVAAFLILTIGIAVDYASVAMAQNSSIELVASSISGGGGEMSEGSLLLESSVGQSEPVGSSSSESFSLESGFIPVVVEQYSPSSVIPTATATPIPNIWDAPATSGRGIGALIAGMILVMVTVLRLTSSKKEVATS
tara:strand:+ start:2012 stop:2470 length:459 start_codon:yes stop_codon:yes gene_type:complete